MKEKSPSSTQKGTGKQKAGKKMTKHKHPITDPYTEQLHHYQLEETIMSTLTDLSTTVAALKDDVSKLTTMVDSLQSQLTTALAQVGVLSAADQGVLDTAVSDLTSLDTSVKAVLPATP